MSQDLCFYQQQIISEKICRNFTHKEINSAIKLLLKNYNLEENENLRNEVFKELEPNLINISAYDKPIEKLIKKPTSLIPKSRFLMVNSKILAAIESIVTSKEKSSRSEDMTIQISKDLLILKDLFEKKLLFINLQ